MIVLRNLTENCFFLVSANLKMKVIIKTKYVKDKNGVNHFTIKDYSYTFDYGDRVTFNLSNLFKESKELSKYTQR